MNRLLLVPIPLIIIAIIFVISQPTEETFAVSPDGIVTYSLNTPSYTRVPVDGAEKISFPSRGRTIVGLYARPSGSGPFPVFVVLPGGNVGKEAEHKNIAKDLRSLGYATFTLDQRGIGETGGPFPPLEQQFQIFQNKNEPEYQLMVADAIHAVKLVDSFPETGHVYLAGVSMGGRVAIIAATQSSVMGVLAVSTSGYGPLDLVPENQRAFLNSINPDAYVQRLHVPLIMIHAVNDTVIPYTIAQYTFEHAPEPKQFFTAGEGHGYYTDPDYAIIQGALSTWI